MLNRIWKHIDDCITIKNILLKNGIDASLKECYFLWDSVSSTNDDEWITLDGLEEYYICHKIEPFLEKLNRIS